MKYIRTKGGIVSTKDMLPTTLQWFRDTKMMREADTIEELIDIYLCDKLMFLSKKQLSHYCYMPDKEIYGAIWVNGEHNEPILKSVAKMNSDGNLELLI